ncbi:CLUMA_CG003343, isoform A [Clunio marinus]|uniref:CLUMA_CG003343, isoform A n=1 Tax=Clunio marinus TaxID=568069 RepID=A0A1J1HN70_9DIPT|nr:CLUMA_CG003343, isoform A [Clunio marinus]
MEEDSKYCDLRRIVKSFPICSLSFRFLYTHNISTHRHFQSDAFISRSIKMVTITIARHENFTCSAFVGMDNILLITLSSH